MMQMFEMHGDGDEFHGQIVFLYLAHIDLVASFVVNQLILTFFISNVLVF